MSSTLDHPVPVELREPANRVSHKARRYWLTWALALGGVPVGGQVIWLVLSARDPGSLEGWHVPVLIVSCVVVGVYAAVMPVWRYRVHRWEATTQAVYTQTGWLHRERRIAPLSRVQTVDTAQGAIARAFGLAKVTVTTASAAGPLVIDGLDQAVAADLVEHLTAAAAAERGDAT
jgi:membrane protein YdbS with pleckstrin-like domain